MARGVGSYFMKIFCTIGTCKCILVVCKSCPPVVPIIKYACKVNFLSVPLTKTLTKTWIWSVGVLRWLPTAPQGRMAQMQSNKLHCSLYTCPIKLLYFSCELPLSECLSSYSRTLTSPAKKACSALCTTVKPLCICSAEQMWGSCSSPDSTGTRGVLWFSDASSNTVATHEEHFVWVCLRWTILPPKTFNISSASPWRALLLGKTNGNNQISTPALKLQTSDSEHHWGAAKSNPGSCCWHQLLIWLAEEVNGVVECGKQRRGKKNKKKTRRTQDSQNATKTHRNKDDKRASGVGRAAYEMKVSLWERKIKELWQQPNWYYIKHGHLGSLRINELPQCLGGGGLKIQFEKCKLMPFYRSRLSRILL